MNRILWAILILVSSTLHIKAQTPSIVVNNPELACLGKVHRIAVTITGSFSAGNQFSIQLRADQNTPVIATIPAVLKGSNIEAVYQDSLLSSYATLQFRVVSSSPKTESEWKYFRIHSKGTIRLDAAISDTINLGEELVLRFTTFSSTEVDITLNDGSQLEVSPSSQSQFVAYHTIAAHTTQPFYIRTATNSCGDMRISGEIKPTVNSTSLRTKSADALNACENSEIRVSFSTVGQPLAVGTKYRVRFRSTGVSPFEPIQTMEAPAELKDGLIVTRIPDHLKLQAKQNFNIIILADERGIVGSPGDFILTVLPKPYVSFFTPDVTINIGDETRVGVIFKGVPPFSAALGEGSVISADYSGEVYLDRSPDKTTTYSIQTMSSACGLTDLPVRQNMTVSVNPGIALVPESYPPILCAGTKAKVRIRSNGNFGSGTSYIVHAYYGPSREYSFAATRNGDYLEFFIPELPASTDRAQLYDNLYYLYVTSQNPGLKSEPSYVYVIQSKPQMVVSTGSYTFDEPGEVTLSYQLYGKWPYTIIDEAGNSTLVKNDWWAPEIYLNKTKDFKIKSISNSCFKTENIPATRLTLTNNTAPGLYLMPVAPRACVNDSLEVEILAPGKFDDKNEFYIQAYASCCNFRTLKTVRTGGTYKVRIPPSENGYIYPVNIKVVSTNPLLTSETHQFYVDIPFKDFMVNPAGTASQPALLPNNGTQSIRFSATGGDLRSLVYSDGTADRNVIFEDPNSTNIPIKPVAGQTTIYTLKSMTNSCGTQPANVSTHIRVVPFVIKIKDFDFTVNKFCTGNQIQLPFSLENGVAGNATFGLEISRADQDNYRSISAGERSMIVKGTLPADLSEGNYKIRVISSDGGSSNPVRFFIGVLPDATISSKLPQPITVSNGTLLELDLHFSGTSPWTAVFEDNTNQTTTHDATRRVYPKTGGLFKLKTVYNQCGYGTVSGSVEVKVSGGLTAYANSYAACKGKSFPVNYELYGDTDLTNDYIRFELIDPQTLKTILLDSTKVRKGTIDLKIPSGLTADTYLLNCTQPKAMLSTEFYIYITRPVKVTISGNTVINNGDKTSLLLQTDNTVPELVSYQLSDGTKGTFLGGAASYITVNPEKTTTYTLASVVNSCGAGTSSGSAIVEVNAVSTRTVTTTSFTSASLGFCVGDSIRVSYNQKGTFTNQNIMSIQLSDTTGKNFQSIPTSGKTSPLRALLPLSLTPGKQYRVRVAASDPGSSNGAHSFPLITGQKAIAKFTSNFAEYSEGKDPLAVVILSGTGPWQYGLDVNNNVQTRYSASPIDSVYLQQALPGQVYKLVKVFGQCGVGTIAAPSTITVSVITAEPGSLSAQALVAPNPTRDYVQIKFESALPRNITLLDSRGIIIRSKQIKGQEENLDIRTLVPGMYLLRIEEGKKKWVYRVVKY